MEQEAAIKKHMSRNFSCIRCKFSTAWERNLRKHMNHGREKLLCQTCPVRFLQKKKVTHFVRHNSETLTKLSCKECDFTNLRKNKLTLSYKHKTHTEAAPFQNEPVQWRWRSPLKRGSQNALDCFSDGDTQLPHHPPLLLPLHQGPLPPRPAHWAVLSPSGIEKQLSMINDKSMRNFHFLYFYIMKLFDLMTKFNSLMFYSFSNHLKKSKHF